MKTISFIAASCGLFYKQKYNVDKTAIRLCRNDSVSHLPQLVEEWFNGVKLPVPVFRINGSKVKVLRDPQEFYEELLKRTKLAKKRITLASLYLGNGEKEQALQVVSVPASKQSNVSFEGPISLKGVPAHFANLNLTQISKIYCHRLVDEIYRTVNGNRNITLRVLLEYTRGSRGMKNSRTMLLPTMKDHPNQCWIALFHTPNLRGILRRIIPERFNETINVMHLKAYLFDDTLIMSGANLSNDYFTNRQDRYIIFEDCPELSNYYDELVKTVSSFSFQLNEDNNVTLNPAFNIHPYKNSKKDFNQAAGNLIEKFAKQYTNISFQKQTISEILITDSEDTLVFPLLQMKTFGIDQDEHVTANILQSNQSNCCICLATAYFNVTDDYWKALLQGHGQFNVVMAHPKAMGFYKAPGVAGGIPKAYSLIALHRYRDLLQKEKNNIEFKEFMKNGWTFHGKGLWLEIKNSRNSSGENLFMTLIGSPNFGKRSVYRDIESQIGIITYNDKLKKKILAQKEDMLSYCSGVTMATFDEDERTPSWWVYLIATFMNDQF